MTSADMHRWDLLALDKGPLRAAWDEDEPGVDECLAELLPYLPNSGIILDLGCGPGRLTVPIADARPNSLVIGLDVSPRMIHDAPTRMNVQYEIGDGHTLIDAFLSGAFSVLMFQHLKPGTAQSYIRALSRWLIPGAVFRFQYVECGGDYFDGLAVRWGIWCEEAGLTIEGIDHDRVKPNWTWVTACR